MKDIPELKVIGILRKNRIEYAAMLPCDRIKALLPLIEKNIKTIPLTREENGVGICAGLFLGGKRSVMVIQSTGIGNMINALTSLNLTYGIPLPVIASWRGVYKEQIEAQRHLGKKLPAILDAAGIRHTMIGSKDELDKIDAAINDSFENASPHVMLISPAVWEGSCCENPVPCDMTPRTTHIDFKSDIKKPEMTRYEAIKALTDEVDGDIIVSNLGVPSKELHEIKDRDLNFYMTGSMGLVSSIGLGLALAQERHVYVIDGDGSILMNPNALTAIGTYNPRNLTVVAVDNAACGSTGNQKTCTSNQIDLELLARANGIKDTQKVHTCEELKEALHNRAAFIHTIVKPYNASCREIPLQAGEIKERFMKERSRSDSAKSVKNKNY